MHEFNIFPCSLVYIISLALCGCSSCLRQQMAAVSRAALSLLVFPPSDTAATEAADEERKSSLCRKKQYNISGSASLHVIDSVLSLMWPRGGKILQIIFGSVFHLLSIMIYRKWVYFCVILIICSPPSSLPHIPLYCTSNFSLPSLSLCLPPLSLPPSLQPSPLRSFWMEAENRRAGMPIYGVLHQHVERWWSRQVHRLNVGYCRDL